MRRFHFPLLLFACWFPLVSSSAAADGLNIVQDGKSRFVICVPKDSPAGAVSSAETLRDYLKRMSGAELPIVQGAPPASNCILFEIRGRSLDHTAKSLSDDGFRIHSGDQRLTLTSDNILGLRNAVYTLLETYLGCRKYSPTVEVVPHRSTISLPEIDDTQIPALSYRLQDFRDSSYAAWHKLSSRDDWGLFVHTFETLVPVKTYFKDHPEYFSENNGVRVADGQLCLSNPDVLRIVVDELRHRMKENPSAHYWSVSQNDTYLPCCCATCAAIDKEEGAQSGSLLRFINRVAAEFPDRTISTLAYQYSRSAPAITKPAPNVNIMLCSIECNRSKPIDAVGQDASFVKDVQDWGRLTHNIFLWDYVIQFRNLVSPFPNLRVLQPNMQFFVRNGINSVFEQGLPEMYGEFAELRAYLVSKLLWNPSVNVDSVMNDFLQGYYGDAAPFVRRYIDTMHDALEKSGEGLSCFGYPFPSKDGYLSAAMMDRYITFFDSAEAAVAGQPDYLFRVQTARLPLQYALLEQAKLLADSERGCFEKDGSGARRVRPNAEALLDTFFVRCLRAGIPRLWEHGIPPQQYYDATRSFFAGSTKSHLALACRVKLTEPASGNYHNGDAAALTDGIVGWDDYHMHWLGFEGVDMDAIIDLGREQTVSEIETSFLQDISSWIFMPKTVEFFISKDGTQFQSLGVDSNTVDPRQAGAITAPSNLRFAPQPARYVRVQAVGLKQCPSWHKGFGGKSWVFCDEIKVY
jgi:hypothetical protein